MHKFDDFLKLEEAKAGYELYHKDFSSAMQHAYDHAKKKHGITIKPSEIDDKVASGPRKPSNGKTNTYRLKGDKGAIQVQVYNTGNKYELNMYKESIDEGRALDALRKDMSKRTASNQSDHAANKARATKNQKDLEDFRKKNSKVLNKKNNEATTPQEEGVEHTKDPKSHVKLNKETGKYCVYDMKDKKVAEFDMKDEAEAYAVKNHDALMNEGVEVVQELTAAEKKLVNTMYDKKGNLTPIGKKVMNHGKTKGDNGFVESVELEEALSPQQISKMKKQYANTGDRISVEASMKMSAMVKKFGDEELVQLAKADIKWISTSAITALIIKGKAKMLDESFDIDAAVTALAEAGLWDNIHNKRKRIKKGSGEKMRKPGSKGAPSNQDFKDASEDADIDEIKIPDLAKVIRGTGLKTFKNKHYNVKKTKTDLAGLKARLAKMG
tara:strand:+ start:2521 stop:3840 length:1320 start_codon:yes stop_codon:yes gene_type:complete